MKGPLIWLQARSEGLSLARERGESRARRSGTAGAAVPGLNRKVSVGLPGHVGRCSGSPALRQVDETGKVLPLRECVFRRPVLAEEVSGRPARVTGLFDPSERLKRATSKATRAGGFTCSGAVVDARQRLQDLEGPGRLMATDQELGSRAIKLDANGRVARDREAVGSAIDGVVDAGAVDTCPNSPDRGSSPEARPATQVNLRIQRHPGIVVQGDAVIDPNRAVDNPRRRARPGGSGARRTPREPRPHTCSVDGWSPRRRCRRRGLAGRHWRQRRRSARTSTHPLLPATVELLLGTRKVLVPLTCSRTSRADARRSWRRPACAATVRPVRRARLADDRDARA